MKGVLPYQASEILENKGVFIDGVPKPVVKYPKGILLQRRVLRRTVRKERGMFKTKIEKGIVIAAAVAVLVLVIRGFLLGNKNPDDKDPTPTVTEKATPTDKEQEPTGELIAKLTSTPTPNEAEPSPTIVPDTPTPTAEPTKVPATPTMAPLVETPTPTEEPEGIPGLPTPTMTEREKDDLRFEQMVEMENSLIAEGYEPNNTIHSYWYFHKTTETKDPFKGLVKRRTEYVLHYDRHLIIYDDYFFDGDPDRCINHEVKITSTGKEEDAKLLWRDAGARWMYGSDILYRETTLETFEDQLFEDIRNGKYLEQMLLEPYFKDEIVFKEEIPGGILKLELALVINYFDHGGYQGPADEQYRVISYTLLLNGNLTHPATTSDRIIVLGSGSHLHYDDNRDYDHDAELISIEEIPWGN